MTERELLEMAAKAAGYDVEWQAGLETGWMVGGSWWNPLTDDGDALRLAVALQLHLDFRPGFVGVHRGRGPYIGECPREDVGDYAATRRAIVRAAAEIGRAMP